MPTYLTPGVYFEELADSDEPSYRAEYRPRPKEEFPTLTKPRWVAEHSTTAFVGIAARGPTDEPFLLTRWREFEQTFGDGLESSYLSDAVRGFFANGGRHCYVLRIDEGPSGLTAEAFIGDSHSRTGLGALEVVRDVSIVCVPDIMAGFVQGVFDLETVKAIQLALINQCEMLGERIAILDSPPGLSPAGVHEWRQLAAGYDSRFATLYYPWLKVFRPGDGRPAFVPPSGHVAGVYARTDLLNGPHHTPANEPIVDGLGVETQLLLNELSVLNPMGINALLGSARGVLVFGSRTLSSDPDWRHLRKRRLVNFISRNIRDGTDWVIFQRADDERVWARLLRDLDDLLSLLWRSGALSGDRPDEAYALKCDAETNPPDVSSRNQIVVEISVAPDAASRVAFRVVYFCD